MWEQRSDRSEKYCTKKEALFRSRNNSDSSLVSRGKGRACRPEKSHGDTQEGASALTKVWQGGEEQIKKLETGS